MLHCRTVLYSHSKRNRNCYPHYTANLLFPTTALSIFVVSIRVIFQYLKTNFLFIPQTIQQIKKNITRKPNLTQMSNGKRIWRRSCRTLRWSPTVRNAPRPTGKRTSTSCSTTTRRTWNKTSASISCFVTWWAAL